MRVVNYGASIFYACSLVVWFGVPFCVRTLLRTVRSNDQVLYFAHWFREAVDIIFYLDLKPTSNELKVRTFSVTSLQLRYWVSSECLFV